MKGLIIFLAIALFPFVVCAQEYEIDYFRADSNLYIYTSYYDMGTYKKVGANGLVIEGDDEVIIVDAPWDSTQTLRLLTWVKDSLQKPVAAVIITHAHEDRIGGIDQVHAAGIPTLATELTAAEAINKGFTSPTYTFSTDTLLQIPGAAIDVFYPGPGHTEDNSVVYVPRNKTLYGGCFLKSAYSKNLGNIADANLPEWPHSLMQLKERFSEAKLVIPGHGNWESGALENTLRLLKAKPEGK